MPSYRSIASIDAKRLGDGVRGLCAVDMQTLLRDDDDDDLLSLRTTVEH